jgi:hypothetical protein
VGQPISEGRNTGEALRGVVTTSEEISIPCRTTQKFSVLDDENRKCRKRRRCVQYPDTRI